MANASKRKGDQAERDAVTYLCGLAPHLVRARPARMLGAGRREDVGDLAVFDDVAVQVRAYRAADIGAAVRSAATDAAAQARNAAVPFSLGLVPVPRARRDGVRWLATSVTWPRTVQEPPVVFKLVSQAIAWVRDDTGPHGYRPYPRIERVAHLAGPGAPVLLAPAEAWLHAYELVLRRGPGSAAA